MKDHDKSDFEWREEADLGMKKGDGVDDFDGIAVG